MKFEVGQYFVDSNCQKRVIGDITHNILIELDTGLGHYCALAVDHVFRAIEIIY